MSRENVELARNACAAFNRRDADALAESCDPELEFVSLVAESEGQVFRGHEGVRTFFRRQDEAFDRIYAEIEEITESGDLLIIDVVFRARRTGERRPGRATLVAGGPLRANRILWWRFFRTRVGSRARSTASNRHEQRLRRDRSGAAAGRGGIAMNPSADANRGRNV
jgi:ketosteroid isomerase-like protein